MRHRILGDRNVSAIGPATGSASTRSAWRNTGVARRGCRDGRNLKRRRRTDRRNPRIARRSARVGSGPVLARFRSCREELEHCTKLGLAFLSWRPLGGIANAKGHAERHSAVHQAANETGTNVHRITHTWELALAPAVIPIPRASGSASIRDFAAAADLELVADQFALPSV
jgi:hypothetical protein